MYLRRLALFDLDHTLVPFDTGMAWLHFLAERGAVAPDAPDRYLDACRSYVAGSLALSALHRIAMAPLARHPDGDLHSWREEFAPRAAASIPTAAYSLVAEHRAAGAMCCIVTTTNNFFAAPYAQALGIDLLASVAERRDGRYTGRVAGELCHGINKVHRVADWLASRGLGWSAFRHSAFYSDSASDLPLLEQVHQAVAVRPDAALRRAAEERGWRIAESLNLALDGLPAAACASGEGVLG